jgi:hypothetical protein
MKVEGATKEMFKKEFEDLPKEYQKGSLRSTRCTA